MIDIDKNLEIFYEREENKEDTYIGAISKHECVVDGWFVIELLEEIKRLREGVIEFADYLEEKITPYMTNDMHKVVPIGGMVSDLHKMIKGDD